MKGKGRHCAGFGGSLLLHALLAFLLAALGFFTVEPSDSTLNVALVGGFEGGSGGGEAAGAEQPVAAVAPVPSPDDITENRPREPERKPVPPADDKETAQPATTQSGTGSPGNNPAGQGSGSGNAPGTGEGEGRGRGQGSGQGEGGGDGVAATLPRLTYYREPNYPGSAIAAGIEGIVHISLAVNARGGVENVALVKSSGWREIDSSVLRAAREWRFSPAKNDRGRSIACTVDLPVNFKLRK